MKTQNIQITASEAILHVFVPPSTLYASVYKVREFTDPEYVNDTGFEIKFFEFLGLPTRELNQHHPLYINAKASGHTVLPLERLSSLPIKPIQAAMAYEVDYVNGTLAINCSNAEIMCGEGYATPIVKCEILTELSASVNPSGLRDRANEFGLDGAQYSLHKAKPRPGKESKIKKKKFEAKISKLSLAVKFTGF